MKALACISGLFLGQLCAADMWPSAGICSAAERADLSRTIALPAGGYSKVIFGITSKGNGLLEMPGLAVRVYDGHDDGWVFEPSLLRCEWHSHDDVLELRLSGTALRTHEKNGSVLESVPVHAVFRYSSKARTFVTVECSPQIDYWNR